MVEDKLPLGRLRRGDADALRRVYEKYRRDMLGLAVTLSGDRAAAEDAVHDAFVSFVRCAPKLCLRTSLRAYLLSAVANHVRNLNRAGMRRASMPYDVPGSEEHWTAEHTAERNERNMLIEQAVADLPFDQREVIILHLQVGMKFREIAMSRQISVNTAQSRYRYGLEKLRSLLDGKVTP